MNTCSNRAERIFAAAVEIPAGVERAGYVERACAGEEQLRREVESLLTALDRAGGFLEAPPGSAFRTAPLPGEHTRCFGDYELLEEIARGGMGVVYKARQISLNRVVAVKAIATGRLASESEVRRFHSEAEAAGSLDHPNIVGIYEVGEQQGLHYYSMPLVEGLSLTQWVESAQWQPGDGTDAAHLLAKLACAVEHAHQQGILHRDLKPGNILMGRDSEPRILDFGLAKRLSEDSCLTLSGDVLGTPGFMAPEHAVGKAASSTAAADIYSLGAILYYLLTGRPPFVANSPLDALLLVVESEAILPRAFNSLVAADLERICLHCLAKSPEARYPSAKDLANDLERFLQNEPLAFKPTGFGNRLRSWAKRQPALASRLVGVAACAMISETSHRLGVGYDLEQLQHQHVIQQHQNVMIVLGLWAVVSCCCQWAMGRERWAETVRFIWAGMDAALLTAILYIDQALQGPLIALYPVWVVGSALWLRVPLVLLTTVMAVLGYGFLIVDAKYRGVVWQDPAHWHVIGLALVVLTGFIAAYLVFRVRVLSRFHDRRPEGNR